MGIYSKAEVKIVGDEYAGFYSCGLTMLGNSSMRRFGKVEETTGNPGEGTAAVEKGTETGS